MDNNFLDPIDILQRASGELSAIAEMCDIDYSALLSQISRHQTTYKRGIEINKKARGKVAAYVKFKTSDKGHESVSITFSTFKHGGITETWNSYEWLKDNGYLDKSNRLHTPVLAIRKPVVVERPIKSHTSDYNKSLSRFNDFKTAFDNLPALTDVTGTYFEKKGFTIDDLAAVEYKRGCDYRGSFILYAFQDDRGEVTGYQKIYDRLFVDRKGDQPRDKDLAFKPLITAENNLVTLKNGSYLLLGKPENKGDLLYLAEGLATGISVFKATGTPTVVCMDVGNLTHVNKSFIAQGYTNLTIAADNDIHADKGGNAGIYGALKATRYTSTKIVLAISPENKKCDFDDVRMACGLDEVARQLTENKIPTYAENSLEFHCASIKYAPDNQLKKIIARACRYSGHYKITTVAEYSTIFKRIKSAAKARGFTDFIAIRHWLKKYTDRKLDTIRTENTVTEFKGITVHDFTGKDNTAIAELILSVEKGTFMDNRGMGVGKTELLKLITDRKLNRTKVSKATYAQIKQHHLDNGGNESSWGKIANNPKQFKAIEDKLNSMRARIAHDVQKTFYVCHRISLTGSASGVLEIPNYDDVQPNEVTDSLAVCVNSMPKYEVSKTVKVLFVDECRQNLEHVLNGTVHNRLAVEAELKAAVQNADIVIFSDADMNDFTVEYIRSISNKPIHAITQDVARNDKTIIELGNAGTVLVHANSALKKGLNVLLATDSMQQSRKADIYLKSPDIMDKENCDEIMTELMRDTSLTDDDVLIVTSENKGDSRQAAFLKNPNNESKKYRLVIHTPVISSGISITHNHFHRVYAIFCNVLSPNEMLQTIARVRTAKEIFVCFKPNHSKDRPTNLQDLLDGHSIKIGRFNPDKFVTEYDEFDKLRLQHIVTRNAAMNDYRRYFIMLSQLKGYRFQQGDMQGWTVRGLSEAATEQKVNEILCASEIDAKQAAAIDLLANPTQKQTDCLHRFRVSQITGVAFNDVKDTEVKFYLNNGLSKISNYELVNADIHELKNADMANHETRDKLSSKTSKHYIFQCIVSKLLDKRVNARGVQGLCKFLQEHHKELASNNMGNYAKLHKYPIKQMNDFLKKIGYELEVDTRSKNTEQWWIFKANSQVKKYAENRAKNGVFETENS